MMISSSQIYEMSLNIRVTWQAHSKSNVGDDGSIRLIPRRQTLADGTNVDACSGNIEKHYHADILTEYMEAAGVPLCPACSDRDSRRAGSMMTGIYDKDTSLEKIIRSCGLCDSHGFLITGKNPSKDGNEQGRAKLAKHSLLEFSFSLALPSSQHTTMQVFTRSGSNEDAQMLMHRSVRSGEYALCVRYKCAGVGVDTNTWKLIIDDQEQRKLRHQLIIKALQDQMLSPSGALASSMLPLLSNLSGALVIKHSVGRAPIYSPLENDYIDVLSRFTNPDCDVLIFNSANLFKEIMDELITETTPSFPAKYLRTL